MCDFHSIAVRKDGAVAHIMQNSHSGAVEAAGWRENDQMADLRGPYFVEAEWSGKGEFTVERITRNSESMNEKQRTVINNHYKALQRLLADPAEHVERMCLGRGIFSEDCYADIRFKVMIDPRVSDEIAAKLAETVLFGDGSTVSKLPENIKLIHGGFIIAEKASVNAPVLAQTGYVILDQGAELFAPLIGYLAKEIADQDS